MNSILKDISDNHIAEEFANRFKRKTGEQLKSSSSAANHLRATLSGLTNDIERFMVIFLDSQLKIISTEIVASGTIASSAVYPREIIKKVLQHEAAHIIVGHNHPSGETLPSSSDRAVTKKLQTALAALDIDMLDHVIVGDGFFSFSDQGLL
jgi:DNA repair protein RadC